MFLDLIDHLASSNKFVPSILLIQSLSQLTYFLHLFILILLPSDLQSYSTLFSSTPSSLLDKHAPLKTISCNSKPNKSFITPEILREKTNVPNLNQFIAAVKLNKIR